MKYTIIALLLVCSAVCLQGCSFFGVVGVEQPPYEVVEESGDFELRQYKPQLLVETTVEGDYEDARNVAFRRLFKYITGNNKQEMSVSMTAPVLIDADQARDESEEIVKSDIVGERDSDGWRMSFVLPAEFTPETAPEPSDPLVSLREVPGRITAVASFSGRWRLESFNESSAELSQWIESQELEAISKPRAAAFNPPWTIPFLRRNETHIDVQ